MTFLIFFSKKKLLLCVCPNSPKVSIDNQIYIWKPRHHTQELAKVQHTSFKQILMCPDYKVNEKQYTGLERNHISRLVSIDSQFSQCISTHAESAASCLLPPNTAELRSVYHCDIFCKNNISRRFSFKTVKITTLGTCVGSCSFNLLKYSQQRHKNNIFPPH